MGSTVRGLFRQTAVYGIGNIITRGGAVLLVPFYAHYLQPADFGILATAAVVAMSLEIILTLRLSNAFLRYYFDFESEPEQLNRFISSLFYSVLCWSGLIVVLLSLVGHQWPALVQINGVPFYPYLQLTILTSFFSALNVIPLSLLQAQKKPSAYVAINVAEFTTNVLCSVYFVAFLHKGAAGSQLGTLCGAIVSASICLLKILPSLRFSFAWHAVRDSLTYSVPLLPNALSFWLLRLSDRVILGMFLSLGSVGIYAFGYNLGSAMAVIVASFTSSWSPLFFDAMKRDQDKGVQELGKTATLIMSSLILIAFIGALIARETIMVLAPPKYYGAIEIVPWVILAYLFHGGYVCFVNILFYFKKSGQLFTVTAAAAAVNIGLNFLLVPRYGIIAAAWSTALAYFISAVCVYAISRRLLRLEVDWLQIGRVALLSGGALYVFRFLETPSVALSLVYKGVASFLFFSLLFGLNILPMAILRQMPVIGKMVRKIGDHPRLSARP